MVAKSNRLQQFTASLWLHTFTFGGRSQIAAIAFSALWLWVASLPAQAQVVSYAGINTVIPNLPPGYAPTSVALDAAGNVYVSDGGGSVQRISLGTSGSYTTLISGLSSVVDLAVDQSGILWVADSFNNRLVKIDVSTGALIDFTYGSVLGYVTNQSAVQGVTVDPSDNVYFSDNSYVYRILAGTSQPALFISNSQSPRGFAVDQAGNAFLGLTTGIYKLPPGCNNTIGTCGTYIGPGAEVKVDRWGNLFVADNLDAYEVPAGCVRTSEPDGEPPICSIQLPVNSADSVAVSDRGEVFVTESEDYRLAELQLVSADFYHVNVGTSSTLTLNYKIHGTVTFGASPSVLTQGTPGLDFTLSSTTCTGPQVAGNSCTLTVSFSPLAPGLRMGAVQLTDISGNVLVTTALRGTGLGPAVAFSGGPQTLVSQTPAFDVAVDAAGNVFMADGIDNTVVKIPAGCTSSACQTTVVNGLGSALKLAVDGSGALLIADSVNNRVVKVPAGCTTTSCQTTVGTGLNGPSGVTLDGAGNVFISDFNNGRVVQARDGCTGSLCQATWISGLDRPEGLSLSLAGDLFVTQPYENTVVEFPQGCRVAACEIPEAIGLAFPTGVTVNAGNAVFVANDQASQVWENVPGCINCEPVDGRGATVVSTGQSPFGLTTDATGNLYIAYAGSHQVVKVSAQASTVSFPATNVGSQSSPQTVTVQNIGNAPLTFTPFSVSANFGLSSATCPSALAPGEYCSIVVYCAPSVSGSVTGTLTITDNALNRVNATQTVPLSCSGAGLPQPTVSFTGAPASAAYQSTFAISATTNASSMPVITSSGACSVSAVTGTPAASRATVTMTSGTAACSLTANWAKDSNYAAATASQMTVAVQLTPNATFTGAPASAAYGSTFPVASSTNASTAAVITAGGPCSISGVTVTMTSASGSCVLTANWAADSNYVAATRSQTTVAVKATPTVTFTGAPTTASYQGTFSVASTTNASTTAVITASGACSISGTTVTMASGTGACSLTATWAADTNYSGTTATQSTTAGKIAPTVTFTGAPPTASYQGTFSVASTTNASTAAVITASGACSIVGTTVTMASGTGACSLTATWAADTNYSGTTANQSTTAGKIAPTVNFTGAPPTASYQGTFPVASTTNASTAAVITASGACSISGTTVTMASGTGTCSLTATWAADTNYSGTTATQSTTAGKIAPVVTFTGAPSTANYQATFTVASTTNASTSAAITASGACSIVGTKVTMTSGTGACSLTATWAADTNYSGTKATQSTTAGKIAPVVTFTGAPPTASYQGTFPVASTTNASTSAVITASGACSIKGTTVTMTSGTGACSLTATWAADNNYTGTTATQSTAAIKIAPTVTFTGAPASAASGVSFTVTANTNASTAATLTASGACSIAGSTVTMTSNVGTCQLTAAWGADSNYLAGSATQTTQTAGSLTNNLITIFNGMNLSNANSFDSQLQALAQDIQKGSISTACSDLSTFIGTVNAQSGKKLTAAQAQQLLAAAAPISQTIGCS